MSLACRRFCIDIEDYRRTVEVTAAPTIAPAAIDSLVIYAGTDDANLWRTVDGGINWESMQAANLPNRWVTKLIVDPQAAGGAVSGQCGQARCRKKIL